LEAIKVDSLTKEFGEARDLFDFKLYDFREITIVAMKSSFLPHLERKLMIKNIAQQLSNIFNVNRKQHS